VGDVLSAEKRGTRTSDPLDSKILYTNVLLLPSTTLPPPEANTTSQAANVRHRGDFTILCRDLFEFLDRFAEPAEKLVQ
jgi:hypothetical protein